MYPCFYCIDLGGLQKGRGLNREVMLERQIT